MQIRKSFNAGHFIGILFVIALIIIIIGFVKLTWSFWSDMAALTDVDKMFPGLFDE